MDINRLPLFQRRRPHTRRDHTPWRNATGSLLSVIAADQSPRTVAGSGPGSILPDLRPASTTPAASAAVSARRTRSPRATRAGKAASSLGVQPPSGPTAIVDQPRLGAVPARSAAATP